MKTQKGLTYPSWHVVHFCPSVVIVENDDGQYNGRCHHKHDAIEISA